MATYRRRIVFVESTVLASVGVENSSVERAKAEKVFKGFSLHVGVFQFVSEGGASLNGIVGRENAGVIDSMRFLLREIRGENFAVNRDVIL